MIGRAQKTLAALLGAQLVLAAGLAAWSARAAIAPAATVLLAFDKSKADQLTIEGPDKARVDLARKGEHWMVAQAGGFEADGSQVAQLLARLSALKPGPAVATSSAAAERFKVADSSFERRISIDVGGKSVGTLLLGSSLGAHQTLARKAGDNDVVGVDLPTYEVPAKADDWLDKTVLQVPRGELAAVEVAGLQLTHRVDTMAAGASPVASAVAATAAASGSTATGAASATSDAAKAAPPSAAASAPAWRAEGLGEHERLSPVAADKLAGALADLRFNALRGRDDAARKNLGTPELTLSVQRRGGQPVDYRLYKLPGGDDHALVVSSRPETFTLASWQAKPLLDAAARKVLVSASK
ncbi:MAG TPA: DUF4340 domain-containing protein [Burkholderiaceae bacterium]|nr:DUF4340 domain-containing protein [Burkholderiaceae bacterium]